MPRSAALLTLTFWLVVAAFSASATVLYQETSKTLIHENGVGVDILHGSVQRGATASDTL